MSYKIIKPITTQERADFIVEHNHNNGRRIEETDFALYALEAWELLKENTVIDNSDLYLEELEKEERKKIANLKLTRREFFLAIYKDLRITPEDIKEMISSQEDLIEFEYATEYYRGNPLIDKIGYSLGYTKSDLDYLFKNKTFPEPEIIVKEVDNNA